MKISEEHQDLIMELFEKRHPGIEDATHRILALQHYRATGLVGFDALNEIIELRNKINKLENEK